ncbi:MAG: heparan-alpha-glucosaminide N-acetyltransferase domain-containing protein [Jiangellaceae bacterium]
MTARQALDPSDTRLPARRRLLGVDAARGVALIGMMSIHILPRDDPDGSTSTAYLIASGRSAALFAVLAGVGLALASGGSTPPRGHPLARARAGILGRAAVLMLVGLFLGAFDSGVAVILAYYAVFFVVAVPFLGLPARVLLPLAGVWAVLAPVLSQAIRPAVPGPSFANPTLESLAHPVDLLREIALTGYYPVLTWTAYLLAGLGIGRLALHRARTATYVLVGGAALAIAAWGTSWLLLHPGGGLYELEAAGAAGTPLAGRALEHVLTTSFFGTTPTTSWWWLAVASPHSGSPLDLLHTIGTACIVLGLMLLLVRATGRLLWPLAAIGSMTFTLYTVHVLLLSTLLPDTIPAALIWHVCVALAIAVPWRVFVGRGPLEWVAAELSRGATMLVQSRPAR